MIRRTVTFKPSYWYHETCDGKTVIHISGRTANNETVYVLVT